MMEVGERWCSRLVGWVPGARSGSGSNVREFGGRWTSSLLDGSLGPGAMGRESPWASRRPGRLARKEPPTHSPPATTSHQAAPLDMGEIGAQVEELWKARGERLAECVVKLRDLLETLRASAVRELEACCCCCCCACAFRFVWKEGSLYNPGSIHFLVLVLI